MSGPDARQAMADAAVRHVPVLLESVVAYLGPQDRGIYIDGTFGAGGHAAAILAAADCRLIGIDRDPAALAGGRTLAEAAGERLILAEGGFAALDRFAADLGVGQVDGIVLDLGVSSMQLDTPARGFSFRQDGPLDMRMGAGNGPTAADVVAAASERDLADIIFLLGEERHARAVARAIVAARRQHPIETTHALADIVRRVVPSRDIDPATRTFQALRLFVNEELGQLADGLAAAERILKPGGRLVVIAFHSLEDRIVKTFLAERSRVYRGSRHLPDTAAAPVTFNVLTRRPITPDETEIDSNPRARSAKLRAAERTDAEPRQSHPLPGSQGHAGRARSAGSRPRLPSLPDVLRGE